MNDKIIKFKIHYIFIAILYAGGTIGMYVPFISPFLVQLTPYVLILTATLMILFSQEKKQPLIVFAFLVWIFTFLVEALGVNTGIFFGHYQYSDIFGITLFNTPLLIGINWFIVVFGAHSLIYLIFSRFQTSVKFNRFIIIPFLIAILATAYDYLLEPIAIKLNYWVWQGGIIPLKNYLTWGTMSLLCEYILLIKGGITGSKFAAYVFSVHLLYYLILNIIL